MKHILRHLLALIAGVLFLAVCVGNLTDRHTVIAPGCQFTVRGFPLWTEGKYSVDDTVKPGADLPVQTLTNDMALAATNANENNFKRRLANIGVGVAAFWLFMALEVFPWMREREARRAAGTLEKAPEPLEPASNELK